MPAIDFPASPTNGQEFTAGATTYVWNGAAWAIKNAGLGVGAVVGDGPPANPVPGQFWWESDTGLLYVWYKDVDSGQWVQCNAAVTPSIPDAPQDGGEYARVNGIWRLKEKSFALAGLTTDIPVPVGAKMVQLIGQALPVSGIGGQLALRVSYDGTTFPAAATDYYQASLTHAGTATAVGGSAGANSAFMALSWNNEHVLIPINFSAEMNVYKEGDLLFDVKSYGKTYSTALTHNTWFGHGRTNSHPAGAVTLKALRFHLTGTVAFKTGSYVNARWMY